MLVTSIFFFSHNVYNSGLLISHNFSNMLLVVCKYFEFGQIKRFVFGKDLFLPESVCRLTKCDILFEFE